MPPKLRFITIPATRAESPGDPDGIKDVEAAWLVKQYAINTDWTDIQTAIKDVYAGDRSTRNRRARNFGE